MKFIKAEKKMIKKIYDENSIEEFIKTMKKKKIYKIIKRNEQTVYL